jgi:hypothetical protein
MVLTKGERWWIGVEGMLGWNGREIVELLNCDEDGMTRYMKEGEFELMERGYL